MNDKEIPESTQPESGPPQPVGFDALDKSSQEYRFARMIHGFLKSFTGIPFTRNEILDHLGVPRQETAFNPDSPIPSPNIMEVVAQMGIQALLESGHISQISQGYVYDQGKNKDIPELPAQPAPEK